MSNSIHLQSIASRSREIAADIPETLLQWWPCASTSREIASYIQEIAADIQEMAANIGEIGSYGTTARWNR